MDTTEGTKDEGPSPSFTTCMINTFRLLSYSLITPFCAALHLVIRFRLFEEYGVKDVRYPLFIEKNFSKPIILNYSSPEARMNELFIYYLIGWVCIIFFPCILFTFYLKPRSKYSIALLLLPGFLVYLIVTVGYGIYGHVEFTAFAVFLVFLFLSIVTRVFFSQRKSLLYQEILKIAFICFLGTAYSIFKIEKKTDSMRLINTCIILPILSETGNFFISNSVYFMTVDNEIAERPNRKLPILLVIFWNTLMTTMLDVASFESMELSFLAVCFQNVIEIVSRLWFQRRDVLLNKTFLEFCTSRKRPTQYEFSNPSVHPIQTIKAQGSLFLRKLYSTNSSFVIEERKEFFNKLIISEIIGEYSGIFLSATLLYMYSDVKLFAPFQAFFASGASSYEIMMSLLFQIVTEIFTDIFCLYFEIKHDKFDFSKAWKLMPNYLSLWLGFTGLYTSLLAFGVAGGAYLAENLKTCMGRDLCYCVNNGLLKGGVREEFCVNLYLNGTPDSGFKNAILT